MKFISCALAFSFLSSLHLFCSGIQIVMNNNPELIRMVAAPFAFCVGTILCLLVYKDE